MSDDDSEDILDELLALRCRRGDAAAWRELIGRYERRLLYYVRRLVDDERDAWDVLQQTWLGAFRNLSSLHDPRSLRPWLYGIARRRALDQRRRRGADVLAVDPDGLRGVPDGDDAEDPLERVAGAEEAECVHAALARLSLPHREVLTLHFLEAAPVEEIADVLGVPPGTVKSRLYYAKRALRVALVAMEEPHRRERRDAS